MNPFLIATLATVGLCLGMLATTELGRRFGARMRARDPEGWTKGTGAAEGAVFALLGLLLAFTFSGAASRFEDRRHLVTAEANAIGTAYLRLDLLPVDAQAEIRALFRQYTVVRSKTFLNASDRAATQAKLDSAAALQATIWRKVLAAAPRAENPGNVTMLQVQALNEMIDITTTRFMATQNHPPLVVFILLGGLGLIAAFLTGYGAAAGSRRLHSTLFAVVLPLTVYVIIELEFPRLGLVQVDSADEILLQLPDVGP